MYIQRFPKIEDKIEAGKVLVIYGARQVGKSSLVKKYLGKVTLENPNLKYCQWISFERYLGFRTG